MDANPSGNTATSLGNLDPCVRVEPGASATIDLVVDAVPVDRPLIGFEVHVKYDPALLQIATVDNEFLLAAVGAYEPFEGLGDILPDSDGDLLVAVADLASNRTPGANVETGKGVLSRITLTARAAGIAAVAPGFNPPDIYPGLIDAKNKTMEVRSIGGIKIAVGQDCPAGPAQVDPTTLPSLDSIDASFAPTPIPTRVPETPGPSALPLSGSPTRAGTGTPRGSATPPANSVTDEGDGGASTGTVILVVALAMAGVALAAGGGFMLYRRRAAGTQTEGP